MMNYLYIYRQDQLLIPIDPDHFTIPCEEDLGPIDGKDKFRFFSDHRGHHHILGVSDDYPIPEGYHFTTLRDQRHFYGQKNYAMALRSYQLHTWRRQHSYCSVCGSAYGQMKEDRSLTCPGCGHIQFPQTSNAVITAILKEDKILLAHNTNFRDGLYSLIAGFVEMGESFEDAVHREIFEEVGIRVKNVRYFDNQEWPFPNSTMIGFYADYDSGDIKVDGDEILDARWYTPDEFPELPSQYSIARRLIENYRTAYQKGQKDPLA